MSRKVLIPKNRLW